MRDKPLRAVCQGYSEKPPLMWLHISNPKPCKPEKNTVSALLERGIFPLGFNSLLLKASRNRLYISKPAPFQNDKLLPFRKPLGQHDFHEGMFLRKVL